MRLLDTYATNTGSTIDKPYIYTKFFPLPCEKYITIQAQTPYDSRNYSYWQDVINLLNPIISKENIKIVQVGLGTEQPIEGTINMLGKTNVHQLAYIIKNSILHFGADSFCVHLASYFDKPIVSLYSISNPNVAGPHFGDTDKHILLKGYERIGNKKPSYSQSESPKSIDSIRTEEIAESVLSLLSIKHDTLPQTKFIGYKYINKILETTPDQIISPEFFKGIILNIRLDYCDNITDNIFNSIIQNISIRPCSIITDKVFNLLPFIQLKNNIPAIIYDVTKSIDINFVKSLNFQGFNYVCVFNLDENNADILEQRKYELMDYCGIEVFKKIPDNAPELLDSYKFKTNIILLSNQKIYNSRTAQLEDVPVNSIGGEVRISDIKDKNKLMEDIDFSIVYE
jgi:hypothetical protein